jgi:hypothetical protein
MNQRMMTALVAVLGVVSIARASMQYRRVLRPVRAGARPRGGRYCDGGTGPVSSRNRGSAQRCARGDPLKLALRPKRLIDPIEE